MQQLGRKCGLACRTPLHPTPGQTLHVLCPEGHRVMPRTHQTTHISERTHHRGPLWLGTTFEVNHCNWMAPPHDQMSKKSIKHTTCDLGYAFLEQLIVRLQHLQSVRHESAGSAPHNNQICGQSQTYQCTTLTLQPLCTLY